MSSRPPSMSVPRRALRQGLGITQSTIGEESRVLVKKSKSGHCEDYMLTTC